jgi:hypothetical protein
MGPPLWSEFLATDPEVRVRFPALPDFLSSGSGTRSTQPRQYNLGEVGCSSVDWIDLAQDRDKWRALVNR